MFFAGQRTASACPVHWLSIRTQDEDSICESQVEPFQREIQLMIDKNEGNELKAFRYNAYLRDIIFQLTLQIYAQFLLFKDITSMYREVHAKCILEGLDLVGKI